MSKLLLFVATIYKGEEFVKLKVTFSMNLLLPLSSKLRLCDKRAIFTWGLGLGFADF